MINSHGYLIPKDRKLKPKAGGGSELFGYGVWRALANCICILGIEEPRKRLKL